MAFKDVPNKVDYIAQEHEMLGFWKASNAFEKQREIHKGQEPWSFIDGPITANNPMGVHHGWGRTYKDLYNRYWTMRGRELRYQQGFDCQGLWVEVEVEKEKGFQSKKDIEEYGLAEFVKECKARVLRFAAVQTEQSVRLGYWMDWNDPDKLRELADKLLADPLEELTVEGPNGPVTDTVENIVGRLGLPELGGSYFTFSTENNYMIWQFLKKCHDKGWLYRGADSMPWCPRCATAISQHEIVTDGYADITHRAVTLKFPLRERENENLLVWTTTPWTLTSNVAAAVGPELDYVKVKQGDDVLYLSKGTLSMLKGKHEVVGELKGVEMEGWTYDGPFDDLPAAQQAGGRSDVKEAIEGIEVSAKEAHRVILWDEVGEDEGTGIVHIAPGAGAEDFRLGVEHKLPVIAPLDEEGFVVDKFGWLSGKQVSEVAPLIFDDLDKKGVLYDVHDYSHRYPTCWRCKTELVFRLVEEWFISMGESYEKPREELTAEEKDRSLRYQIMDVVDQIRWIPEFGHAREMDWLRNMHDWMISKKRYWGLALPIWVCEDCEHYDVIGDEHELEERATKGWDEFVGHTPHRPHVDAVKVACPECDGTMSRIPDVGNPWLDAGIVSFSTLSYRADREYWDKWYPANWISESFPGQFRNWFYSLLAMGTVIDNSPPFLENFGYALLFAEDGRAMHKSWGNSIEFNEAADKMGVDVMRWLYCAHKPENNLLFGYGRAEETRRRFLIPWWNVYSFFTTYANLDGWTPKIADFDPAFPEGATPQSDNPLDKWVLGRLNQVVERLTVALENSDAFAATLAAEPFLDDLTNWYVRRSRRRFWRSELDADKGAAYETLWHVLVKLARTLAPIVPFVTEVMYQNLVAEQNEDAYGSVHHTSWPEVDAATLNEELLKEMELARRVASLGLSARESAALKVRQPLSKVMVHAGADAKLSAEMVEIVEDELNVKALEFVSDAGALVEYRVMPDNAKLGPRFGADFPKLRAALDALDGNEVNAKVEAEETIVVSLNGEDVELTCDEVLVNTQPAEGLAVAVDKYATVAIDSVLTPELKAEGLAREVVRRIQSMRKDAGFNIEDRITTYYQVDGDLAEVFAEWADYIKQETLSNELVDGAVSDSAHSDTHKVDGQELVLGVEKK
ncbi:MAG: isoleucine--tRNA ligase [Chloroflexi bacterium]|nr:MAG: isoleucine--tRNA ligase [Chloroflexota bacterium]NOH10646.1 isoleucine--tRNA ligase [Chloroflexota bacterium]